MQRQPARVFTELIVWQKAHQFVLNVYKYTGAFLQQETYGLTAQLRRAAISIAANIAEGFKRLGKQDKRRFLNISQGSAEECRYYLILAADLGYGNVGQLLTTLDEVSKLLEAYGTAITASI